MFLKTIMIILCTAFLIFFITAILNFFGIDLEIYINYLVWILALIVFYCILPSNSGTVFTQ